MLKPSLRSLLVLWFGWLIVLLAFQSIAPQRLNVKRPDYAVMWSAPETGARSQNNKPYLLDPFLNAQVSWDSEYYISIALAGYDDPASRTQTHPVTGQTVSQNYAFFPLYPYVMRVVMWPLRVLALTPIATAALAGVIVSALGTLAGLLALWDLARATLDETGALRGVFYLLIFPTGFFLAQVYTEGLFIGLAFGALALSRRKQWLWASALAVLAAWTRAHGAALVLPLIVVWWQARDALPRNRWLTQGAFALAPLAAYFVWRLSPLGQGWEITQITIFQRGLLDWGKSLWNWSAGWQYALTNSAALVYFGLEVFTIALAFLASLALLRTMPDVALFSLAVVILSVFSGVAQSMARYMLVAPAAYIALGRLGRSTAFDKTWTLASTLTMSLTALLFSFDMWVG